MKFAVQSIVFGPDVDDALKLREMCRTIRAAGFTGVELFQDFRNRSFGGPEGILTVMVQEGVHLVGVTGGSLTERFKFVRDYCWLMGISPRNPLAPYAYVDEWDHRCVEAIQGEDGIRVAIHPHMFRPVQTIAEAEKNLNLFTVERFSNLQLLPDTAHMMIAGDDGPAAIKRHLKRLAGIHVKDWNPNVGRSYQFYVSAFCGLGEGKVPLRESLRTIWFNDEGFHGWVVIEQDASPDPQRIVSDAMRWLRDPAKSGIPAYIWLRTKERGP